MGYTGQGIVMATMDSGVNLNHANCLAAGVVEPIVGTTLLVSMPCLLMQADTVLGRGRYGG